MPENVHRTPRTRALEIGTDPAGFEGAIDYIPQAGVPASAGGQAKLAETMPPRPQPAHKPSRHPVPYK
jgi:hypothetical protein